MHRKTDDMICVHLSDASCALFARDVQTIRPPIRWLLSGVASFAQKNCVSGAPRGIERGIFGHIGLGAPRPNVWGVNSGRVRVNKVLEHAIQNDLL